MLVIVRNRFSWDSAPKRYEGTPTSVLRKLRGAYRLFFAGRGAKAKPADEFRALAKCEAFEVEVRG